VDDDPFAPARPTARPAPATSGKSTLSPANDDPFAPATSGRTAPPAAAPEDDDPFAPVKSTPAPRAIPAAPIAAEPSKQLADGLALMADGRLPVRDWSDTTGQFRTRARLVLILGSRVRLLKQTGRTTTVPLERLSPADRAYVEQIIRRYGPELEQLDQLAAK
jgi:hypothetical protein